MFSVPSPQRSIMKSQLPVPSPRPSNAKRFSTSADPLLPLDVWTFDNSYVELLGDSPLRGQRVKRCVCSCFLLMS